VLLDHAGPTSQAQRLIIAKDKALLVVRVATLRV
jgi:hypothetical protein